MISENQIYWWCLHPDCICITDFYTSKLLLDKHIQEQHETSEEEHETSEEQHETSEEQHETSEEHEIYEEIWTEISCVVEYF